MMGIISPLNLLSRLFLLGSLTVIRWKFLQLWDDRSFGTLLLWFRLWGVRCSLRDFGNPGHIFVPQCRVTQMVAQTVYRDLPMGIPVILRNQLLADLFLRYSDNLSLVPDHHKIDVEFPVRFRLWKNQYNPTLLVARLPLPCAFH